MEFMDETILKLRRENKEITDLDDEILVNGQYLIFEYFNLFNNSFKIKLPEHYVTMPEKIVNLKYPAKTQPMLIKTDLVGKFNYIFNYFDYVEEEFKAEDIEKTADEFYDIIKTMNPANEFFERDTFELENDTKISWFDFKGYALDDEVYNIFYFTQIKGHLLHGTFNCPYEYMNTYKNIVLLVIKSITEI